MEARMCGKRGCEGKKYFEESLHVCTRPLRQAVMSGGTREPLKWLPGPDRWIREELPERITLPTIHMYSTVPKYQAIDVKRRLRPSWWRDKLTGRANCTILYERNNKDGSVSCLKQSATCVVISVCIAQIQHDMDYNVRYVDFVSSYPSHQHASNQKHVLKGALAGILGIRPHSPGTKHTMQ